MSTPPSFPARYYSPLTPGDVFRRKVLESLQPGLSILDVGSGNDPVVAPKDRPSGTYYVGLDISRAELERAPAGSYDEVWASDITVREPTLAGRFDMIVSFQVLEHVRSMDAALENIRSYLRPGGVFLALLSGGLVYFAILNRMLPQVATKALLRRANPTIDTSETFAAYYHHCYASALERDLRTWSDVEIIPFHAAATYLFRVIPRLGRLYLALEDWLERGNHRNLASNYAIRAVR